MKNVIIFTMLMGFSLVGFAQKADSTKTPKITLRGVHKSNMIEPLVVIDGNKQYIRGTSVLNEVDQDNIESISVFKDSLALAKYGLDGVGGVIEVTTKNPSSINRTGKIVPKNISGPKLQGKATGITIRPISNDRYDNSSFSITNNGIKLRDDQAKPLYIIDGKEAEGIENIDKESIKSISVIKDAAANSKYGDKGKNGVIIITTKKATPKKN
jgi:TonB-dependent SusC/RagA subfamily outer membrane receptor